jgi:putative membrane protein
MKLSFRPYLRYKFFNSLFTGVVGGSVFTIYGNLSPITFSIGGIILALGMMGMAYLYHHLMRLEYFFRFSLLAELIMLLMVSYFLIFSLHSDTALIIYGAYQLSFMLGGYLIRAETHFAKKSYIMGWIDVAKQQGYLTGLLLSYGFYKLLDYFGTTSASLQVYDLHFILFPLELLIIAYLLRAFRKKRIINNVL